MDKNKKSMILAIVAVISFIVITVGTTVAFFNYVLKSKKYCRCCNYCSR